MTSLRISALVAAAALAVAAPSAAQDMNAAPRDAALSLSQDFDPDPRTVAVIAGGALDASSLSTACAGAISEAANVRLDYSGGTKPLIISADSGSDVSLVVIAPNGALYCDDDGGEAETNPALRFARAQSGAYLIWVGAASEASAEVQISATQSR